MVGICTLLNSFHIAHEQGQTFKPVGHLIVTHTIKVTNHSMYMYTIVLSYVYNVNTFSWKNKIISWNI